MGGVFFRTLVSRGTYSVIICVHFNTRDFLPIWRSRTSCACGFVNYELKSCYASLQQSPAYSLVLVGMASFYRIIIVKRRASQLRKRSAHL